MSGRKDGGLAFPFNAGEHGIEPSPGMTLRDWFAGQHLVAMGTWQPPYIGQDDRTETERHRERARAAKAAYAYAQADAMLAERSK